MNCQTVESLLHGYFDNELDLARSLEIERHLETCAACSARLDNERSLRTRISAVSLDFPAPSHLSERIALALDRSVHARKPIRRAWEGRLLRVAALAAGVVLFSVVMMASRPSSERRLAQQIRDGHVRSLMAAHLADVASSDQHMVKPWFAAKLSFSPWVGNLSDEGFPLVGGRLDYIDNRPMAAVVFKRRKHVINLFSWPAERNRSESPQLLRESGYQMMRWADAGMTYWAISDLNAAELEEFVRLVESQASRPGGGAQPRQPLGPK